MRSLSLDFYGGMLWCVDKLQSGSNDIRDTSLPENIVNVKSRLDFDKNGYDSKGFLNSKYRGPVLFDMKVIFGPSPINILGWEGAISTFGAIHAPPEHSGMHVDSWLSLDAPTGKMANNNFGLLKTGDDGHCWGSIILPTPFSARNLVFLNYWAHNMRRSLNPLGADDFHIGYTLYYV